MNEGTKRSIYFGEAEMDMVERLRDAEEASGRERPSWNAAVRMLVRAGAKELTKKKRKSTTVHQRG